MAMGRATPGCGRAGTDLGSHSSWTLEPQRDHEHTGRQHAAPDRYERLVAWRRVDGCDHLHQTRDTVGMLRVSARSRCPAQSRLPRAASADWTLPAIIRNASTKSWPDGARSGSISHCTITPLISA